MSQYKNNAELDRRFEFGANWTRFLSSLNDKKIQVAEDSLRRMLATQDLQGKTFLDVGSGSGLFSLAARRLGARVRAFDYDSQSAACTVALKHRYFPDDPDWIVEEGSVLDSDYLHRLGRFDVVYSWGVLHHTGAMWRALENVAPLVAEGGKLFIAIYNDQGASSKMWLRVKQAYNALPRPLRWLVLLPALIRLWGPRSALDILQGKPFQSWRQYGGAGARGMSPWHDVVDWVGGLPFEVAQPAEIFDFYRKRGFQLEKMTTRAGQLGCNEFVFTRQSA